MHVALPHKGAGLPILIVKFHKANESQYNFTPIADQMNFSFKSRIGATMKLDALRVDSRFDECTSNLRGDRKAAKSSKAFAFSGWPRLRASP